MSSIVTFSSWKYLGDVYLHFNFIHFIDNAITTNPQTIYTFISG